MGTISFMQGTRGTVLRIGGRKTEHGGLSWQWPPHEGGGGGGGAAAAAASRPSRETCGLRYAFLLLISVYQRLSSAPHDVPGIANRYPSVFACQSIPERICMQILLLRLILTRI